MLADIRSMVDEKAAIVQGAPVATGSVTAADDLGVPIDLIDPEQYTVTGQEPPLNELDRELIEGQEAKKKRIEH